jgi:hypothetical protein
MSNIIDADVYLPFSDATDCQDTVAIEQPFSCKGMCFTVTTWDANGPSIIIFAKVMTTSFWRFVGWAYCIGAFHVLIVTIGRRHASVCNAGRVVF